MKTSIQNCADKILKIPTLSISDTAIIINILAKAMDEEKQQIIDAVKYGQNNHSISISHEEKMANDYYTSTFTTNKETLK